MEEKSNKKEKNSFTKLKELLRQYAVGFNDGEEGYAEINFGDHYENLPIRSKKFKQFVILKYHEQYKQIPSASALASLIEYADATALMIGGKRQIFRRIANYGGNIYIDLGDPTFKAVEITPGSWSVIDKPPVVFVRNKNMKRLPPPERGGLLDELKKVLNCNDDHCYIMIISWLVTALNPERACPILLLTGEQGSAKSTSTRILHNLIDPSEMISRSLPQDEKELFVGANNSWVLSIDNVSGCGGKMSDGFSRLVTGAAYAGRQLYTDGDESVIKARRPMIINGINTMASKPDLVARIINVELEPISFDKRIPESLLKNRIAYHQPRIMGALYDAVAWALRYEEMIELPGYSRMADFVRWATAAGNSLGWKNDTFINEYKLNMEKTAGANLEDDVLAQAVTDLMAGRKKWTGYMKDLLETLNQLPSVINEFQHDSQWPKNASVLSRRMKLIAEPLRNVRGIDYRNHRDAGGAKITIKNTAFSKTTVKQPAKVPDSSVQAEKVSESGNDIDFDF